MSSNLGKIEPDMLTEVPIENRETVSDLLDNKEINGAAFKFKNGMVKMKRMVDYLPQKSVARVYKAIVEFPLGDAYPKFRNPREQELFNLTLELNTAKNMMIEAVVAEQKKLASKLEVPKEPNETENN